jgi:hypothetical protein
VLFHIGFSGAALRVEGPGGFGNQDVGFTPAQGAPLHTLSVQSDGAGQFSVTLEDGNSAGTFTESWTNFALGLTSYTVGLQYNSGVGIFDNWTIGRIPEPASLLLLAAGAVMMLGPRRRMAAR